MSDSLKSLTSITSDYESKTVTNIIQQEPRMCGPTAASICICALYNSETICTVDMFCRNQKIKLNREIHKTGVNLKKLYQIIKQQPYSKLQVKVFKYHKTNKFKERLYKHLHQLSKYTMIVNVYMYHKRTNKWYGHHMPVLEYDISTNTVKLLHMNSRLYGTKPTISWTFKELYSSMAPDNDGVTRGYIIMNLSQQQCCIIT
jgi:hypothetical protein